MTFKETLFFIGKCLTINHEKHNYEIVEEFLISNAVDWEAVVKVSTSHYVFPALYCNLRKANFLDYLPKELVKYMKRITDLNRERNEQIIEQAKEINTLLQKNNITPIFLKGAGNLLEDLYEDIAERMVGDIDFLVSNEDLDQTNDLLKSLGYYNKQKQIMGHRHLPRLIKNGRISAVEIHNDLLKKKFSAYFNFNHVHDSLIKKNNIHFLSNENKIKLTALSYQINDFGYYYKRIHLKQCYDIFLVSSTYKETISDKFLLHKYLNSFLGLSSKVLNTKKIRYHQNNFTNVYIRVGLKRIGKKPKLLKFFKKWRIRSILFIKSFYNTDSRNLLFSKIFSLNWIKSKIGFK